MKKALKSLILTTCLVLGVSTLSFGIVGVDTVEAASTVKITKTAYQTTANLNMRKGAGTNYTRVLTIPKGKTIYATEKKGTWYKVSYTYKSGSKSVTKTGWVSGSYIKKKSTTSTSTKASTTSTTKMKKTTFQTTAGLNLRSGAGTTYKSILTIPKGKTVTATEKKGTWYKVSYTYKSSGKNVTKTGWVSGKYLKEYYKKTSTSASYYFTKKTTVYLRSTPDTKKKAVYSIGINNGLRSTQKVVNSVGETWYRVAYNGKTVYVNSKDVNKYTRKSISKTTLTAAKTTYIYESYGRGYKKLVKIPKGTKVTSTLSVGKWNRAKYNGKLGYVFSKDFTDITVENLTEEALPKKTFLINTNLNVRKAADIESTKLTVIPKGKIVTPTHKVSNGWYKVTYSGKTGYVSGNYVQEVRTGDPLTSRKGYQFIDLRTKSKVKASQIDKYIASYVSSTGKKSVLTGKGQAFIDAGNKYGVNALFLAAHAIHESAYGTSNISLGKYNLFGFGAYDATPFIAAYRFKNVDQNIEYIAQELKASYLNANNWKHMGYHLGFSTKTMNNTRINENSEGMNFYYASDPNWGKGIAAHMERILPYDHTYYSSAKPNTTPFSAPARPSGSDKFPDDILGIAKKSLALKDKKGSSTIVKTIKKDTEFFLVEKTNDFWIKVLVDDEEYWTNDIDFVKYKDFITIKNLGRVTTDVLNVRSKATTVGNTPIATLKRNQYVHIVLTKNSNPSMDSTKTWYKVQLADGTIGWVSSQYIAVELK